MNILLTAIVSGLSVGLLSGLVGIGGGVLLVPLLLYVFKVDMHIAAGTSLAIIIPTALVGVWGHFNHGNVDWRLAAIIAIGGILGSFLGAWLANILPSTTLKKIFAFLLLLISIKVIFDAYGVNPPWASSQPSHTETAATVNNKTTG